MTTGKERTEFTETMAREGVPPRVAAIVMREAKRHHKLAEAECNGDWPADNGEREVMACHRCEAGYVPSTLRTSKSDPTQLVCPSCQAEEKIRAALKPYNVTPVFQGDPRGATVKLKVPSGRTDDWGRTGVCVPVR